MRRRDAQSADVAFAGFGNDQALGLLSSDLDTFAGYPGALEGARLLTEAHGSDFWESNLYNLWFSSLRALNPAPGAAQPSSSGMPQVTGSEAWGRRILNAQLDTCQGPRAYAGVVFAYHEKTTKDFERLSDEAWKTQAGGAADVPWMMPVIGPW